MLTPEPVTHVAVDMWLAATANRRNANLASLTEVDKLNDPLEPLLQRGRQKSAGSSKNSPPREVSPMRPSRTARSRKVGPFVNSRIVDEE